MAKIAIVGTGIGGMASAYLLKEQGHDITIFEKNDYIGGHTHTIYIEEDGAKIPIDTGFIVFNETNYPYLVKLFKKLNVPYQNTDMSFAVSNPNRDLEYCGSTLNTLFCQRKNIFRPTFYKLLCEINRFNKLAPEVLTDSKYESYSIERYFKEKNIGELCFSEYLIPMSVALWSAPRETIKEFPIVSLVNFFKNHGLLGFTTQYQWKTVTRGSWSYRDILINSYKENIKINSEVQSVSRTDTGCELVVNDKLYEFDKVLLAGHADQTFDLLKNPTELEKEVLSKFKYQKNIVDLHTDIKVMPKRKLGWAAWNHTVTTSGTYVSYWMNRLQSLDTDLDYFVSLNASEYIDKESILRTFEYDHPIFDVDASLAQKKLHLLNQQDKKIFYCGSYFGNGFHEDAMRSSVKACEALLEKESIL